jgi:hypothetical protein
VDTNKESLSISVASLRHKRSGKTKRKYFPLFAEVYIRFVSLFTIALANVFCQVHLRSPAKRGNYIFANSFPKGFYSSRANTLCGF